MQKKNTSALISVFNKEGIDVLAKTLHQLNIKIFSTGGTYQYIEKLGVPVMQVETLTKYPSILGGRVKTLHPLVFGGILARRNNETDVQEMNQFEIPEIDIVIVDLYPFEKTVASTSDEKEIIEKIDIGGPSMIRAAAKNFGDVTVIADKADYLKLNEILIAQEGKTNLAQRKSFAAKAFEVVTQYDVAIAKYFNTDFENCFYTANYPSENLRYGENPHQQAKFFGNLHEIFNQLHGKQISYNNLVDIHASLLMLNDFENIFPNNNEKLFAIFKHTNICGIALRNTLVEAWNQALAGDPESAFGGIIISNSTIDEQVAKDIDGIFFEVLIAPAFEPKALEILKLKKNRILLELKQYKNNEAQFQTILNGVLWQQTDKGNEEKWDEVGGRNTTETEKQNLLFANFICKHLKSNAIAIVSEMQLIGKGCGQTSRVDALRQAFAKAKQNNFKLQNAVLASDAFFPFDDCVKISFSEGVQAFIQPGGSIRDKDSIQFCVENNLAMVLTGKRHFKH